MDGILPLQILTGREGLVVVGATARVRVGEQVNFLIELHLQN